MPIKRVPVIECSENYLLAEEIRNSDGVLLASEGTRITNFLKDKLISFGIVSVKIYDFTDNSVEKTENLYPQVKTNYTYTLDMYKTLVYDICLGKKLEHDKILEMTDQIHANINESRNLIRCLNELQRANKYTYTHSINTSIYCMLIAKWMGLSDAEIQRSIQAGLLHDIGKLKIPDTLLNKRDRLTEEEFETMKKHTIYGFELLNNIDDIDEEVKRAALMHHERVDGSGYPYNSSADFISLISKITAVADVYDAITSDRTYSKRRTPFDAFLVFRTDGISMFDNKVLNTFLSNIDFCYIGSRILLNNGETGKVIHIPLESPHRPIIEVNEKYIDLSENKSLEIVKMIEME